jgi:hypothetical protein
VAAACLTPRAVTDAAASADDRTGLSYVEVAEARDCRVGTMRLRVTALAEDARSAGAAV